MLQYPLFPVSHSQVAMSFPLNTSIPRKKMEMTGRDEEGDVRSLVLKAVQKAFGGKEGLRAFLAVESRSSRELGRWVDRLGDDVVRFDCVGLGVIDAKCGKGS